MINAFPDGPCGLGEFIIRSYEIVGQVEEEVVEVLPSTIIKILRYFPVDGIVYC